MPEKSKELANLARIGKLAVESGTRGEIAQLRDGNSSLVELLVDSHPAREVVRNRFRLARLNRQRYWGMTRSNPGENNTRSRRYFLLRRKRPMQLLASCARRE